eukprot:4412815-Prorocentrum_lima.AAC.1
MAYAWRRSWTSFIMSGAISGSLATKKISSEKWKCVKRPNPGQFKPYCFSCQSFSTGFKTHSITGKKQIEESGRPC